MRTSLNFLGLNIDCLPQIVELVSFHAMISPYEQLRVLAAASTESVIRNALG
jgi:hypothetical protein